MVVELLHYHRKESRFSSVEALQTQLLKILNLESNLLQRLGRILGSRV